MAGKNTAVFGIYPNRASVDSAVDALKAAQFRNTDISVLFPDNSGSKDFAHEKNTKAPEARPPARELRAVLGGGLGWLVGIGALAIPGVGPFIAAGPIMAALAGAGVGGAVGGLTGALIGYGNPGIRSQALRRPRERWRDSVVGSLRRLRVDQESEGNPGAYRRSGRFLNWGSQRREKR